MALNCLFTCAPVPGTRMSHVLSLAGNSEGPSDNVISSTMETAKESLVTALQCNSDFQSAVARKLKLISDRKAENRRLASRLTSHISTAWQELDAVQRPPAPVVPEDSPLPKNPKNSSKWNYDPSRSWARRFFVDPDKNVPEPNDDTAKRRKLEAEKFFHHTSPPWAPKEEKALLKLVAKASNEADGGNSAIDFSKVAQSLNNTKLNKPRSSEEVRLKYLEESNKKTPFTKEESIKILENVHLHNGNPNWQEVAASLLPAKRTAWQCMIQYQTKLENSRLNPWTRQEDEILLKYIASMGPQLVLTMGSAAELSALVLPDRSPKQILARANSTLVNPNLMRDLWTDTEEKKLVLLQKIYREAQNPPVKAAAHFPNRATKSVTEKWERSLNPNYTLKAFTAEEDRALLEAIQNHPDAGWTEVARCFPTSRQARNLANRFREIATPEDLLKRERHMMQQEGARRGIVGGGGGLLSTDDFVVRPKQELTDAD